MKKVLIFFAILLSVSINDASAYFGPSVKTTGYLNLNLGVGNIRSDGEVVDGLIFNLDNPVYNYLMLSKAPLHPNRSIPMADE